MIAIFFVLIYLFGLLSLFFIGYLLMFNKKSRKIVVRIVIFTYSVCWKLKYKEEINDWKAMKRNVINVKFKEKMKKLA